MRIYKLAYLLKRFTPSDSERATIRQEMNRFETVIDVIPGPKVFETQIHGKRFDMYNDTVLGFNKSGKEVARIQVEEPIYIRPAERVNWL